MSDYIKREDVLQAIAGLLNVTEQIDSADVVEVSKILKVADEQERIGYIHTAETLRSIVWKNNKGREI